MDGIDYYPPAESVGGWRTITDDDQVRTHGGMDLEKLDLIRQKQEFLWGSESWGIAIIRNGYLVREYYTFSVSITTRFDIWSGTKSFTGTAWGLLQDDSRQGKIKTDTKLDLDSPAYAYIPEGYPLTDPRKEEILIRHLLTMTSGIGGESKGIYGNSTATDVGPFEQALGRSPNRFGKWVDKLIANPGMHWEYSDPAMAHLSLAFHNITGQEMSDVLKSRVLDPIGIESFTWDVLGGSGFMGPHTSPHTGVHISARELARFGYLMLRRGKWNEKQLISEWWVDLATKTSQEHNPDYGYTWWVNTNGTNWPAIPCDAYALAGYRINRCYIIPSLDLVVVRIGSGPPAWEERGLISEIVDAVVD